MRTSTTEETGTDPDEATGPDPGHADGIVHAHARGQGRGTGGALGPGHATTTGQGHAPGHVTKGRGHGHSREGVQGAGTGPSRVEDIDVTARRHICPPSLIFAVIYPNIIYFVSSIRKHTI